MENHIPKTNHRNPPLDLSNDHLWEDEWEPPSFRHLSRLTSLRLDETSDDILLTPGSTPPQSPAPRWSLFSPQTPPPQPPNNPHHPLPPNNCLLTLRHHDGIIHSITVARGLVFTGSISPYIRAWEYPDCIERGYIQASSGEVRAMLAHGNMLFTSHKDHKIRVWAIPSSPEPKTISRSTQCACTTDPYIRPKKITTLPKQNPLKFLLPKSHHFHRDIVSCMAYNMAEGILYTGSYDKSVKAWRIMERKCVDSFVAHADNINDMVINEDGYLFTCSSDGTLKMWSRVSNETFHTLTMTLHFQQFPIHALVLTKACVSEEGCSFLYSGSSDGSIHFWEQQITSEYTRRGVIQAHQFGILCLAIVEDLVVSGSVDSGIKIWKRVSDGKRHECVGVLEGHKGPVKCITGMPCLEEGILVFSAGFDRTFKVWKVRGVNEPVGNGGQSEDEEVEIVSPVLSPSWVKKVQHGAKNSFDSFLENE